MPKFYIYTLAYPPEMGGTVFYVGKGSDDRIRDHERDAMKGAPGLKHDTIRRIWAEGYEVIRAIVHETDDEREAHRLEQAEIAAYKRKGDLTNTQHVRPAIPGHGQKVAIHVSNEDADTLEKIAVRLKLFHTRGAGAGRTGSMAAVLAYIARSIRADRDWWINFLSDTTEPPDAS